MSCVSTRLDATHALITRSLVLQALEWRAAAQLVFHLDTEQSPSRRPMSSSSVFRSFLESRLDLVSLVRIHEENGRGRKAKGISKDSVERSLQRSKRPQGVR